MRIEVLAILPRTEDRLTLTEIIRHSKWHLNVSENVESSRTTLEQVHHGVVMCDSDLPDGNWKNALDELKAKQVPMPLIVSSRHADDRLWAEVINLGGYDVLAMPFRYDEVICSISGAWRLARDKWLSTTYAR